MKLPPIPKQSIKNLVIVYLGAAVNAVSLFLVNAILIRTIDTEAYGAFTLAVLTLTTLAEMSDLGLNGAITRFVPQFVKQGNTAALGEVVHIVYKLRVWLSAGITCLGLLFAQQVAQYIFGQPEITHAIRIGFLGVGGVVLLGFVGTYLQATQQFVKNTILQILKGTLRVSAVLLLALTLAPTTPLWYIAVFVIVPWILIPFFWHALPDRDASPSLSVAEKQALKKDIASFSGWLVVWSFAAIIGTRVDQIMLSNMLSLDAVAIYAYGFQFVFAYSFLQQSFSAIIAPKMNAVASVEELHGYIKRIYQWLLPGIFGVSLLSVLVVSMAKPWLFPGEYTASIPVFALIVLGTLMTISISPYSQVISVYKQTRYVAISGILGFIINVIGNYSLIPLYGPVGAAITYVISLVVVVVFLLYIAKKMLYRLDLNVYI